MKCFILFAFILQIQTCPDRWALAKVDIWTHRSINGQGEHKKSTSIYQLDHHEMIEVTKANVSILCEGMIKNFNNLKYLTLVEANITRIQEGAFQNLPSLTHLSLAVNHLSSIERKQFQSLPSLKILYLSKNQIENIETDAFMDLMQLRKIYLDRNQIHEIDSKWFLGNTQLSLIDLSFNNISKIQKKAFYLPKNTMIEIRLQNNEIEEIESQAIISDAEDEEIPYITLHFERNNLTQISEDFVKSMDSFHSKLYFDSNFIKCFDPKTLRLLKIVTVELHADKNPLSCDCLEAARNFVNDNELKATFYYSSTQECQLLGLKPDSWNQNNMYFSS